MATFQDEDDYLDGVGSDEEVVESIPDDAMIYVYKILVVGDSGTGKTSIINRYTKNEFPQNYKATVCNLDNTISVSKGWCGFCSEISSMGQKYCG